MKASLIFCLLTLLSSSLVYADQAIEFPENKPLIELALPDGWDVKSKSGILFANPSGDSSYFMELSELQAGKQYPDIAIKEAKASIEDSFKNVVYSEKIDKLEDANLKLQILNAKGEDAEGKANINAILINHLQSGHSYMLLCISSQKAFEKYGETGLKVINSIKAYGKTSAVQTYSYPNKNNPLFAVDFPADWVLQPEVDSAYIESKDKLVAMNVLLIDQSELEVAVEKMKKSVGAKYETIIWNQGRKPETVTDKALGVTGTFNNGQAQAKGVKYFVNFVQYAKTNGKKFLVLIVQAPIKALDTHADSIEKVIKSIKVK